MKNIDDLARLLATTPNHRPATSSRIGKPLPESRAYGSGLSWSSRDDMEVPRVPPTRRPHRKSRLGCLQCKQRKVKCDEGKPSCEKCVRYATACSFLSLQPSSPQLRKPESQSPASQLHGSTENSHLSRSSSPTRHGSSAGISSHRPPNGRFSMDDMELLFHYTTSTSLTTSHDELYQQAIPRMAFTHDFLMHAILALSALHLARLHPDYKNQYLNLSDKHLQVALPAFTATLQNITQENCHACMAFSMVLGIYVWATPEGNMFLSAKPNQDTSQYDQNPEGLVKLVQILRGITAIHQSKTEIVFNGPLSSLFLPWFEPRPKIVRIPLEIERRLDDLTILWTHPQSGSDTPLSVEDAAILDCTLPVLKKVYELMYAETNIQDVAVALSWLILITDSYLRLLQARNPQALVMLAYYCPLLKRVDRHWWLVGNAERLLKSIQDELGPLWDQWLAWPLSEIGMSPHAKAS